MKIKYITWAFFSILALSACDDKMSGIGDSILPEDDRIISISDTIEVNLFTTETGDIYYRSSLDLLGSFSNPGYGQLTCDFLTQFYPAAEMDFGGENNVSGGIDSMVLRFSYSAFVGDSLTPMQLSVYELNNQLPSKYFYTSIDPALYCNKQKLLGRKTYTASDISVPDSAKDKYYVKSIVVPMPQALVDRFNNADSTVFSSKKNFAQFFPGIYVTNTYGNGTVINFAETSMRFYFKVKEDTLVVNQYRDYMSVTNEITNINRISNLSPAYFTDPATDTVFLKTPAGLHATLTFPTQNIINKIKSEGSSQNVLLNAVRFSVSAYPFKGAGYGVGMPAYLLFVRESQYKEFFEKGKLPDGTNSFMATYNSTDKEYNFGNIASFIYSIMKANPDTVVTDEKIVLIPVTYTKQEISTNEYKETMEHSLQPMIAKLKPKTKVTITLTKQK